MKKTLLGVLAFVLVLATVLTGTVLAADDTATDTTNLGEVKMVDADHPILVDGELDEAYTTAIALPINFYNASNADIYTRGVARFVWSKAENALYCHVIMNDVEVAPPASSPWVSDSVEMFVDLTNTGTQSWGISGIEGDGAMSRGLQYRIEGFKGIASCYLLEEKASTYLYDDEFGRLANDKNLLINENKNIFGWEYSDDATKTCWGYSLTQYGYMVEFRINAAGQGITLADGQTFKFDFQVNDRWGVDANGAGTQSSLFYASTYRQKTGAAASGSVIGYYDSLTLSDEVAQNTYSAVAEAKLVDYGMEDASFEAATTTAATERTYTSKVTIDRVYTTRKDSGNTTTKATQGGTTDPGTNPGGETDPGTNPGGDTDPGTNPGGCGGSVAIGTSVAMLALVGATGFFAFRKKDEE